MKEGRRPKPAPAPSTLTKGTEATVPTAADRVTRPRCDVVGVYCEALWWLRREPAGRIAALCCRSYWADAEQVAS